MATVNNPVMSTVVQVPLPDPASDSSGYNPKNTGILFSVPGAAVFPRSWTILQAHRDAQGFQFVSVLFSSGFDVTDAPEEGQVSSGVPLSWFGSRNAKSERKRPGSCVRCFSFSGGAVSFCTVTSDV